MEEIVTNQGSDDACRCSCHGTNGTEEHLVPCCNACPTCGIDVRTSAYKRHVEQCGKEVKVKPLTPADEAAAKRVTDSIASIE